MATKIELDYKRMMAYQEINNNLRAVSELFRHGDILVRNINNSLVEIKRDIDQELETSFTKQDFNDILNLRNNVLYPIFQSASFAAEFTPYDIPVAEVPPVTIVEEFTPPTPPVEEVIPPTEEPTPPVEEPII